MRRVVDYEHRHRLHLAGGSRWVLRGRGGGLWIWTEISVQGAAKTLMFCMKTRDSMGVNRVFSTLKY